MILNIPSSEDAKIHINIVQIDNIKPGIEYVNKTFELLTATAASINNHHEIPKKSPEAVYCSSHSIDNNKRHRKIVEKIIVKIPKTSSTTESEELSKRKGKTILPQEHVYKMEVMKPNTEIFAKHELITDKNIGMRTYRTMYFVEYTHAKIKHSRKPAIVKEIGIVIN